MIHLSHRADQIVYRLLVMIRPCFFIFKPLVRRWRAVVPDAVLQPAPQADVFAGFRALQVSPLPLSVSPHPGLQGDQAFLRAYAVPSRPDKVERIDLSYLLVVHSGR